MTFYHGVEEAIEAKFPRSPFTNETFELQTKAPDGTIYTTQTRLFERELSKRRDISILEAPLWEAGALKSVSVRRVPLKLVDARSVFGFCNKMADEGQFCYVF